MCDVKRGTKPKAAESGMAIRIAKVETIRAQNKAKIAQRNEVVAELIDQKLLAKKPARISRTGRWVPPVRVTK